MRFIIKNLSILILAFVLTSCGGDKERNNSIEKESKINSKKDTKPSINISSIKESLCNNYPKALELKYNTDATKVKIESVDNGSGGILHCKVKLFYGDKDYEFWEGQVTASINQMKDPFWQYNPKRNAILYQKVDNLGERAVFISNMSQLQILKAGVVYSITPPNHGKTTNTGKEIKNIAIEIAKHYKL